MSAATYISNTSSKYQMMKSSREHRKYFDFFDYASQAGYSVLESDHFPVNIWRSIKLTIIQENHPSLRLGHFVLCWGHAPHLRTLVHNCLVLETTSELSRSLSVLSQHKQQRPAPLATKLSTQGCRSILHLHSPPPPVCSKHAPQNMPPLSPVVSQPDSFQKSFFFFF